MTVAKKKAKKKPARRKAPAKKMPKGTGMMPPGMPRSMGQAMKRGM